MFSGPDIDDLVFSREFDESERVLFILSNIDLELIGTGEVEEHDIMVGIGIMVERSHLALAFIVDIGGAMLGEMFNRMLAIGADECLDEFEIAHEKVNRVSRYLVISSRVGLKISSGMG